MSTTTLQSIIVIIYQLTNKAHTEKSVCNSAVIAKMSKKFLDY